MIKYTYPFFLIAIVIALFLFERDLMFADEMNASNLATGTLTLITGALLALSFIPILLSRTPIMHDKISRRFTYLLVYIYILSVIFSMSFSLGSRNMYGMIILPLFLFHFTRSTSRFAKSDSFIIWTFSALFLLLGYYFLTNYYNNTFYDIERQHSGSYMVLYLLPFMLCHKNKLLRFASIILSLAVMMYSLKRGGFLALIFGTIAYIAVSQLSMKNKRPSLVQIILFIAAILGLLWLISYWNNTLVGGLLQSRFENDELEGSGRVELYRLYIQMLFNSSPIQLLFGHGWQGSMRDSGIGLTCHNDFLESFVDFGIFGFVLYIVFFVELIKTALNMVRQRNPYAPAMAASITIFFVNSMVSHILIYPKYLILFSLFWGFMASCLKYGSNDSLKTNS